MTESSSPATPVPLMDSRPQRAEYLSPHLRRVILNTARRQLNFVYARTDPADPLCTAHSHAAADTPNCDTP